MHQNQFDPFSRFNVTDTETQAPAIANTALAWDGAGNYLYCIHEPINDELMSLSEVN